MRRLGHATVLGAGTMGAQIAAHLANAGVPCLLLDVTAQAARDGLERARRLRPDPFFTPDTHRLITTGAFETDLPAVARSDWIIEAIVERLDAKRDLYARLEAHLGAGAIVSSNTSGIPIAALGEGRSERFRRHFLGTHFFNPPRYLPLLEVIPSADTDPAVVDTVRVIADHRLGKSVVVAKDTPGFIGNRIALFGVARLLAMLERGWTIEEIDAVTGAPLGRPKSATFRTMDLAGLDILVHVANDLAARLSEAERDAFRLPAFVHELVRRGWTGEKAGRGFYRRASQEEGGGLLVLDPATLEYRPSRPVTLPAIEAARAIEDPGDRIRTLFLGRDRVGELLRLTLGPSLLYAARVAPDIAHSIDDIDRAMRWGFGWELGPFETWDAVGLEEVLRACAAEAPLLVRARLDESARTGAPAAFRPLEPDRSAVAPRRYRLVPPAGPDLLLLRTARERCRVVRTNPGASLIDLGDGVLALELHSKMNAIGADTIEMLARGAEEAARSFAALVVATEAAHFSAGANLMLLLLEAQEGNWEEIDAMVRAFQRANLALRYSPVPVVIAPAGLTLGGGCEILLHGARAQAAAESYIGLVETGVGLVPAGGGTKEMLARAMDAAPAGTSDLVSIVRPVFETIGFAKVSASAADARRLGFLREVDGVTMNRERLAHDAKQAALALARDYRPPAPRTAIRVGGEEVLAALRLGLHLAWRAGHITDHDRLVGDKLAWILAGGDLPHAAYVSEQYLLDLEREAFVSLCGERKTQERMAHTLKTGKPLRN